MTQSWNRNARYWKQPSIEGNMNRWTPLDAYRPILAGIVATAVATATAFIYPEFGKAPYLAAGSFIAGIVYADGHFWEFRASLYQHLDEKYGPSWQKMDDSRD